MDNIEKEIIEYFTHFLIKLRSLTQKLQIYVEIERPVMIKQTYYFYEILKDTQSAINVSQGNFKLLICTFIYIYTI